MTSIRDAKKERNKLMLQYQEHPIVQAFKQKYTDLPNNLPSGPVPTKKDKENEFRKIGKLLNTVYGHNSGPYAKQQAEADISNMLRNGRVFRQPAQA